MKRIFSLALRHSFVIAISFQQFAHAQTQPIELERRNLQCEDLQKIDALKGTEKNAEIVRLARSVLTKMDLEALVKDEKNKKNFLDVSKKHRELSEATPEKLSPHVIELSLPVEKLFEKNSSVPSANAKLVLARVAEDITKLKENVKVLVESYTDASEGDNRVRNSAERAAKVYELLVKEGIPQRDIAIAAYGEPKLQSQNIDTQGAQSQRSASSSRRINIIIRRTLD